MTDREVPTPDGGFILGGLTETGRNQYSVGGLAELVAQYTGGTDCASDTDTAVEFSAPLTGTDIRLAEDHTVLVPDVPGLWAFVITITAPVKDVDYNAQFSMPEPWDQGISNGVSFVVPSSWAHQWFHSHFFAVPVDQTSIDNEDWTGLWLHQDYSDHVSLNYNLVIWRS